MRMLTQLASNLTTLIRLPMQLFIKLTVLPEKPATTLDIDSKRPLVYVIRTRSYIHLNLLAYYCKKNALPSPFNRDGQSHNLLFLSKRATLFNRSTQLPRYDQALQQLLKQHGTDLQLIPVSFYWGRNPGKENAYLRLLFSDREGATFFQRLFIMMLQGRNSFLTFGEPLQLEEAFDDDVSTEKKARKVSRILRVYFHRQRLATMGPVVSHRRNLGHSIIAADPVQAAIKREMSNKNLSYQQASRHARNYFNEMASDYNYATIRFFSHFLTWLWNKLYDGVKVQHIERLREIASGHELVFVPCHRSHMDYLLISYVLYHKGLMIPHIAAGINLNFWPAGGILRRAGAFFMRRSFASNKLYTAVFNEYVYNLFNKGYSVEYFVEGGRSRTGRLLPPKTGMISMTMQSILRGTKKPVLFVPTYISYDRIVEVKSYFKELQGKQKKKESVGQLLGMSKVLKRSYGKVQVCFGEPIDPLQCLKENLKEDELASIYTGDKPSWLNPEVNKLADKIVTRINETASVSSIGIVSMVMLELPRLAIETKELEIQLDFLYRLCAKAPYSADVTLDQNSGIETIRYAMSQGLLQEAPHPLGSIAYVTPEEGIYMHYYKNNIIHLFILPALCASCFVNQQERSKEEVLGFCHTIYPFIKNELFLPWDKEGLDIQVEKILAIFVEQKVIKQAENNYTRASTVSVEFNRLRRLSTIATSTLERFGVTVSILIQSRHPLLTRKMLEDESLHLSQRIGILHARNSPDLHDRSLIRQFIAQLKSASLIRIGEHQHVTSEEQLHGLHEAILSLLDQEIVHSLQLTMNETYAQAENGTEQVVT